MRIKLSMRPQTSPAVVPINYQYPLSAAIYKILHRASPVYAEFLHEQGYEAPSGRLMKLFTFSRLWVPAVHRRGEKLHGSDAAWKLQISSPMMDAFVQNFVLGLFDVAEIVIAGQGVRTAFRVEQVETLAMPAFKSEMRFKCLSPITASTGEQRAGRTQIHYYRPHEPELSEALRKNLLEKYRAIHGRTPDDEALAFRLQPQDRPKSSLIRIKEGQREQTNIRCFETYFTLSGSTELMQTAWQCGLGEHNSQGFGMIETAR